MVDLALETEICGVETVEPDVAGNLVPALSPDAFLFIERWLVRRQVFKVNSGMVAEKETELLTFVPFCAIHIELDGVTSERSEHMLEDQQESFPVSLGSTYEPFPPQHRGHPSGKVEPLVVLAGGRNSETLALFGPTPAEAGMKAEASLILKDNRLIDLELAEFFLTADESPWRPLPLPEGKRSLLVSDCSPGDAASIGPGVPSTARPVPVSGGSPVSAHPRRLSAGQILAASFPSLAVIDASIQVSVDQGDRAVAWVPSPGHPLDSHRVNNVPESCDSNPTKRLFVPDAGPPKPTAGRRSLALPTPPELASPGRAAVLWSLRASESRLS